MLFDMLTWLWLKLVLFVLGFPYFTMSRQNSTEWCLSVYVLHWVALLSCGKWQKSSLVMVHNIAAHPRRGFTITLYIRIGTRTFVDVTSLVIRYNAVQAFLVVAQCFARSWKDWLTAPRSLWNLLYNPRSERLHAPLLTGVCILVFRNSHFPTCCMIPS